MRFWPIEFDRSGKRAAVSCENSLLIMEKAVKGWISRYKQPTWTSPTTLSFDQDGALVASGHSSGDVHVWSTSSNSEIVAVQTGLEVVHVDITGEILTVGSATGQLDYYDLPSGRRLGRTHVHSGGMVTTTTSGFYAQSGSSWPVAAFAGGIRLNEENSSKLLSSREVSNDLFQRDNIFFRMIMGTISAFTLWFSALPTGEKLGVLAVLIYLLLTGAVFLTWLLAPAWICSLSLRLKGSSIGATIEGH
jgi:WD40 repeat protein